MTRRPASDGRAYTRPREVSVIVPTTALVERGPLLRRALDSILGQTGVRAIPTVVVNGPGRDPAITRDLLADPRLRVVVREPGGLAAALRAGRRRVDTPWFAELDDDDVLLPGALRLRLDALDGIEHDCVVTNGLRRNGGEDTLHIADIRAVERDPIRAFFESNWLLPGSYLCHTDRVGRVFDGMPSSLECSFLALRLAASYRVRFVDRPTVVWHVDTPGSLSKSREWILAQASAYRRILDLDLPRHARREVRERMVRDCHMVAHLYLQEGRMREAWRWHLRSLVGPGGQRFVLYTRKLVWATLARDHASR